MTGILKGIFNKNIKLEDVDSKSALEIEVDNIAATGVKEYKDSEVLAIEVQKRQEIEEKQKTYRDARLVYRAEKRLASKVFGTNFFREELPKLFNSLYDEFELTETWISASHQKELLKKTEREKQNAVEKHNRQIVDEVMTSVIEGAFQKQADVQRSTKK